ncbi:DUF1652 domain-containing protein [Pseudomonas capeferrum]|uniref:DUF1652 domain-containing protein n=1 Tax=Pseudomonas capeferrum TaxID=1495066 RepID=UPI0015E3F1D5|nr:DUF1652 domain-containing protein [Pseudomonas capeferrum]MBA1200228.1 DUF1652 domain-containing protein [Pseudomonas capeferrum]
MSMPGVSLLEMRQLIEQACLPDRCEVSCPDGISLNIRLGRGESLEQCLILNGIPLASINHSRDLLALVNQLRTQQRPGNNTRSRAIA